MLKSNFLDCSEGTAMARKIDYSLADLGGAPGARPPPFAWHPSSLVDLGGGVPGAPPPFAWHPSF